MTYKGLLKVGYNIQGFIAHTFAANTLKKTTNETYRL